MVAIDRDLTLIALGVAGFGAALRHLPGLTAALTAGGALFLAWYGMTALCRAIRPTGALAADAHRAGLSRRAALVRTAGFTLLNPHVYLDTVLLVGAVGAAEPLGGQPAFILGAGLASALWFATLGTGLACSRHCSPGRRRGACWMSSSGRRCWPSP